MTLPSKAIILAAGLGERMRPLSTSVPKAMMPFAGKPIIDHTVKCLMDWGVKDILINLHHAPSPLVEYVRNGSFPESCIAFSFEPEIRGTGGAIRQASWFIGKDPFWIINSDIVFELDPEVLAGEFARRRALACLWVTSRAGPRTVDVRNHKIESFSSAKPGTEFTATFCGLHLVSPGIMEFIPNDTFSSVISAYAAAIKDGRRVLAVEDPGSYWADIGSPEKLIACHKELASARRPKSKVAARLKSHLRKSKQLMEAQGVSVSGMVSAAADAVVSRSAKLENSIICSGVRIGPHSSVKNCIVADHVNASGKLQRAVVNLGSAFDTADRAVLESQAWLGSGAVVEALPPRGSNRQLFRLHGTKTPSLVIKYDDDARPENAKFAQNLQFLSSLGLPVPALLLDRPSRNMCVVEDLGDVSLQDATRQMPAHLRNELYRQIIRYTAVLHSKGAQLAQESRLKLEPPFTPGLYAWERELFAEHYLKNTLRLSKKRTAEIEKELRSIPAALGRERVLIHRDLQSSNIMLKAGRPVLIDFQGMRLGPRHYDLASLLLDPYVSLDIETRKMLTREYSKLAGLRSDETERMTYMAGIQRLAQALGAFGRLRKVEGMGHFAEHMRPALILMNDCMAYTPQLPALAQLINAQLS